MKGDFFTAEEKPHRLSLLKDGRSSLLSRIYLIRNAANSIDIQTFLWRNDACGRLMVDELLQAASNGVQCRLLIDYWVPARTKGSVLSDLLRYDRERENFSVKLFHPITDEIAPNDAEIISSGLPKFSHYHRRMHSKLLLTDETYAISGGRNIGDEYFDSHEVRSFLDLDILYAGEESKRIAEKADEFWNAPLSVPITELREEKGFSLFTNDREKESAPAAEEGGELLESLKEMLNEPDEIENCIAEHLFFPEKVTFIEDSANVGEELPTETGEAIEKQLAKAEEQILISSPYLIPPEEVSHHLLSDNVRVRFCTNSLITSDNIFTYAASQKARAEMLAHPNIHFFELREQPESFDDFIPVKDELEDRRKKRSSEPKSGFGSNDYETNKFHCTLHAKFIVVDRRAALVGAVNFDPRSLYHNTETLFVVEDPAFVEEMIAFHDSICSNRNSWVVAPTASSRWTELLEKTGLIRLFDGKLADYGICYEPRSSTEPEIPDRSDSEFFERYEEVGPYPNVEDSDKEIHLFIMRQISSAMGDLL